MYRYKDQKDMRNAMNGRMLTMVVGVFLLITAVTSTLMYGIQYTATVHTLEEMSENFDTDEGAEQFEEYTEDATDEEIEEFKEELLAIREGDEEVASQLNLMTGAGFVYYALGVCEIVMGILAAVFSNRLDWVRRLMLWVKIFIGLEVAAHLLLIMIGAANIMTFIAALIAPGCLMWAVSHLRKTAAAYPDRKYAVEPRNPKKKGAEGGDAKPERPERMEPTPIPQPRKKSLMERANMPTLAEDTADEEEPEEDAAEAEEPEDAAEAEELTENIAETEETTDGSSGREEKEE